ncbi:polysaccharide deacetylase family protein [Fodinisporobacter ferrooxydans]|uniref:Polysaccharide deacetylase family protein n=1 Tax=Fodinisporobacter ferrooxydans TaxID=2901836 RepID=A0ABY4CIZ0_9BACL|nr:polysaccharide deacetylase family protein [Alicyclobacillaceae bacterium MYW30-H2]
MKYINVSKQLHILRLHIHTHSKYWKSIWCCMIVFPLLCHSSVFANTLQEQDGIQHTVHQLAQQLKKEPIDAKMDPVWKAIPGLNGLEVEETATIERLKLHKDRSKPFSPVFKQIPPNRTLQDLMPAPIYRGNPEKKQMALMINVAWGEEYLPSILETLGNEHVKATFFFDGSWLSKHPDLAKEIVRNGHDFGNHGYHHLDMDRISIAKMNQEITDTNEQIKRAIGQSTRLFAPPSGAFNQTLVKQAFKHQMHTILWTLDTVDWKRPPARVIVQRIVPRAQNGAMVLMHPTAPTAAALKTMIPALKAKGYQLVTVSELLSPHRPEPLVNIANVHP